MGPINVRLVGMEIDDLIVSLPLVGGAPQQRILLRNHSDAFAEVRRAPFGCDPAAEVPWIYTGV